MSLKLYDDALLLKIRNWVKNSSLNIVGPNDSRRLFELTADITDDKPIELPLIAIKRTGAYDIQSKNKQAKTFDGFTLDASIPKSIQLNCVPIGIHYSIDIYTRYFEEADEYLRNLVFNIINFPKVEVQIPYNNVNIIHNSNISIRDEVEDNSEIPERLLPGQFTRLTIGIDIDDAYLWDARVRDNIFIDVYVDA